MKKGSGLRRSPASARAWQQRTRDAALARELDDDAGRSSSPRSATATKPIDRVHFKPALPARGFSCERCARVAREAVAAGARGRAVPEVRQAAHWHHWLEQQHLKTYARSLRLHEDDEAREYRRLIHDERNTSPVCVDCHGITGLDHGSAFEFDDVPPAAFAFAGELGGEWLERVRRAYMGRAQ